MCFGFVIDKNEWQGYAQLENVKRTYCKKIHIP